MQKLLNQIEYQCAHAPDAQMFALWRAVLSLVYVDHDVDDLEAYFVQSICQIFKFSEAQRSQIEADMKAQLDPVTLFEEIEGAAYRAQFFRLARIVIWCDGILHEDELEIVNGIVAGLGDEAAQYESEVKWIGRKPDLPFGESASIPEEEMMKHVLYQMIAFYEELGS